MPNVQVPISNTVFSLPTVNGTVIDLVAGGVVVLTPESLIDVSELKAYIDEIIESLAVEHGLTIRLGQLLDVDISTATDNRIMRTYIDANGKPRFYFVDTSFQIEDIVGLRHLLNALSNAIAAGATIATRTFSDLSAITNKPDNTLAYVLNDPTLTLNGIYSWSGLAWVKSAFDPYERSRKYSDDLVNSIMSIKFFDVNNEYFYVVEGQDGRYAPLISRMGQTLTTKLGKTSPVLAEGEHPYTSEETAQLYKGQRIQFITYDRDGKVMNLQTEGGIVTPSSDGNYEFVGQIFKEEPFPGFIDGERPHRIFLNAEGKMIEVFTREGGHFIAVDGVLVRIGSSGTSSVVSQVNEYSLSAQSSIYGESVRVSLLAAIGNIIYGVGVNGQSNAYGSSQGYLETQPSGFPAWTLVDDPVLAIDAIYPSNALMLNGKNPRQFGVAQTTFVPLVESREGDTAGETLCSGLINHLIYKINGLAGVMPTFVAFVCAQGATSYVGLKRGSTWYQNTLIAIKSAFDTAKANGKTYIHLSQIWVQGENDQVSTANLSVNARKAQMRQYRRQMSSDIKDITGQKEDVVFFEAQIAHGLNTLTTTDGAFNQKVKQASVELDGDGDIRLACPFYQLQTSGNGNNQIHMSCKSNNELGQRIAQAVFAECFGNGWRAFKPITSSLRWISSTSFIMDFDVPRLPIVIDTSESKVSTVGLGNGYGFFFDDYTNSPPTISVISVVNQNQIQFTLSAAPSSKSVRMSYAMRATDLPPDGYGGPYGPLYGPRGCIRDSVVDVNLYTSQNSYNWLNAFYMNFTCPY